MAHSYKSNGMGCGKSVKTSPVRNAAGKRQANFTSFLHFSAADVLPQKILATGS